MLTYKLFKTVSKLLSTTSRNGQPDADLHAVQNPEQASINNQEMASQMPTYRLFKTKSMLLSAITKNGWPDANLHPVQTQSRLLSEKEWPARC